ncbi:sialate O-acetylesterase [Pedobacter rhodius]|uniref:9-O-acetylesterase n=1 Tax=Pedobacter rhodius TaxID=3004098 RepID=A0ABT4L102_9SPHI|nr:sialate O-acetylesterase [Pedobacter sp. SJ11]MCZ4224847.1 9-O-acetylesterase [Pedobacter sp. SJ11]
MYKIKFLIFLFFLSTASQAEIKLPNLVGSNMVLQRDKPIKLWGYGKIGEKIQIAFAGKNVKTVVNANGKWQVVLPKMQAGGPFEMVLQGENKITLSNILIGDVWLCSGQSNMEFNLQDALNSDNEVRQANYPQIRLYSIDKQISLTQKDDSKGNWNLCTPENAKYFPAIGYFFGRRINLDLKVPVGLINASWGGTVIESWISSEGLSGEETFGEKAKEVSKFDTAAYNQKQRLLNKQWVEDFNKQDDGLKNGEYVWANENASNWNSINLPSGWEFTGKPDLWEMDGIVWFKKEIELNENDLKNDALLNLGVILNADETFFNGELIGKTGDSWGKIRNYTIPQKLLKIGKNVITVRIENYGGDGGFMSKADLFYLNTNERKTTLAGAWKYKIGYKLSNYNRPEKQISPNTLPTLMYNNMISPVVNFSIKGVLWYQGESNWDRGYQYRALFPRMISDWRTKFKDKNFPFLFVQLANYHKKNDSPADSYWAEVREAQDLTQKVNNTGMVTAIDVGDPANIHPKNKQEVGRRLALLAEKQVYHLPVDSLSAAYESFTVKDKSIIIQIKTVYDGLKSKSGTPGNFQIAGADKIWYWATAKITAKNTIEVSSEKVEKPVAVRYAWEDNPADANVINSKGFPLFPFRTDDWNGVTYGKK